MSSQISSFFPRVSSSLLSATGADFSQAASEGVPTPPPDGYVPMSERDPRQQLSAVVKGRQETKVDASREEGDSLATQVGIYLVGVFVAIGTGLGLYQAIRRNDDLGTLLVRDSGKDNANADPDSMLNPQMKTLIAKLADAEHLLEFLPERRNLIVEKWRSLTPKRRQAAIEAELGVQAVDPVVVPQLPTMAWAEKLNRILESMLESRADFLSVDGLLTEVTRLEADAVEFASLLLFEDAANAYLATGRAYEGVDGKHVEAMQAYHHAAISAASAGDNKQASVARREADRVWIGNQLHEALKVEAELTGTYGPKKLSQLLATRIVMDETIREMLVNDIDHAMENRFASSMLKEGWREALPKVMKEIEVGLAPDWRDGITEFVYGQDTEYRDYQRAWWYTDLVKEEVGDISRLVVRMLDWPLFPDFYVKDGRVTKEGLEAIIDAEKERIFSAKPIVAPAAVDATKPSAKEGEGWVNLDPRRKLVHDRLLEAWGQEPGSVKLLGQAIQDDELIVEIGKDREMIPAAWITEHFSQMEIDAIAFPKADVVEKPGVAEVVVPAVATESRKEMTGMSEAEERQRDEDIRREFFALSKAEQKRLRKEAIGDFKRIGKDEIPGPFYDERMKATSIVAEGADAAEFLRNRPEEGRQKADRNVRPDKMSLGRVK